VILTVQDQLVFSEQNWTETTSNLVLTNRINYTVLDHSTGGSNEYPGVETNSG
jgi:hypothetical protein